MSAAVSPGFIVAVKLNSKDFQKGGFTEDESMAVVEALETEGIDLLEVSGGTYESAAMFEETVPRHDSSRKREAFFMAYAEKVRSRTRLPILLTGGFRTAAGMTDAVTSGAVDVVGLARPLAVEPDLSARLLSGDAAAAHPVRIATGLKKLDAVLQGAWYQAQIKRIAAGEGADPDMSRTRALWGYLRSLRQARKSERTGGAARRRRSAVAGGRTTNGVDANVTTPAATAGA